MCTQYKTALITVNSSDCYVTRSQTCNGSCFFHPFPRRGTSVDLNTSTCTKYVRLLQFASTYADYKVNTDNEKFKYFSNKTEEEKKKFVSE